MGSIIIIAILVVIILFAIKSVVHRIRHGSACCGERDAPQKKVKVKDKNKAHYPFQYILAVDGMRCSNCTRNVENALNSLDGIWATADLQEKEVIVLSKTIRENSELERIVAQAGYTVLKISIL
jgi:copper chaperone CopZ